PLRGFHSRRKRKNARHRYPKVRKSCLSCATCTAKVALCCFNLLNCILHGPLWHGILYHIKAKECQAACGRPDLLAPSAESERGGPPMRKRILAALTAASLAVSLAACGSAGSSAAASESTA